MVFQSTGLGRVVMMAVCVSASEHLLSQSTELSMCSADEVQQYEDDAQVTCRNLEVACPEQICDGSECSLNDQYTVLTCAHVSCVVTLPTCTLQATSKVCQDQVTDQMHGDMATARRWADQANANAQTSACNQLATLAGFPAGHWNQLCVDGTDVIASSSASQPTSDGREAGLTGAGMLWEYEFAPFQIEGATSVTDDDCLDIYKMLLPHEHDDDLPYKSFFFSMTNGCQFTKRVKQPYWSSYPDVAIKTAETDVAQWSTLNKLMKGAQVFGADLYKHKDFKLTPAVAGTPVVVVGSMPDPTWTKDRVTLNKLMIFGDVDFKCLQEDAGAFNQIQKLCENLLLKVAKPDDTLVDFSKDNLKAWIGDVPWQTDGHHRGYVSCNLDILINAGTPPISQTERYYFKTNKDAVTLNETTLDKNFAAPQKVDDEFREQIRAKLTDVQRDIDTTTRGSSGSKCVGSNVRSTSLLTLTPWKYKEQKVTFNSPFYYVMGIQANKAAQDTELQGFCKDAILSFNQSGGADDWKRMPLSFDITNVDNSSNPLEDASAELRRRTGGSTQGIECTAEFEYFELQVRQTGDEVTEVNVNTDPRSPKKRQTKKSTDPMAEGGWRQVWQGVVQQRAHDHDLVDSTNKADGGDTQKWIDDKRADTDYKLYWQDRQARAFVVHPFDATIWDTWRSWDPCDYRCDGTTRRQRLCVGRCQEYQLEEEMRCYTASCGIFKTLDKLGFEVDWGKKLWDPEKNGKTDTYDHDMKRLWDFMTGNHPAPKEREDASSISMDIGGIFGGNEDHKDQTNENLKRFRWLFENMGKGNADAEQGKN